MATPTLSELLERISDLEAKATVASTRKEESSAKGGVSAIWGWLLGLIAAAGIAIGAFFLLRNLKKKNEELAALRTQVAQDKVTQANLEHEAAITSHTGRVVELQSQAETLQERIRAQERRIASMQSLADNSIARVRRAQTWAELDKLNEENR